MIDITTKDIKDAWVEICDAYAGEDRDEAATQFDNWLALHDAKAVNRILGLLDGLMEFKTDTRERVEHMVALKFLKDAIIKDSK